jgi:hypothetical protein
VCGNTFKDIVLKCKEIKKTKQHRGMAFTDSNFLSNVDAYIYGG